MNLFESSKLQHHVTFCIPENQKLFQVGRQAELYTVSYLVDNLIPSKVGDYRILVNYNLPIKNSGSAGTLEIDLVVINKFGIFLIEVKDWHGYIDAYDDCWKQNNKYNHANVSESIGSKAKIFHGQLSNWLGVIEDISGVSVTGIITLFQGLQQFENHSNYDDSNIFGIEGDLIRAISSTEKLFKGDRSKLLTNEEISNIFDAIFKSGGKSGEETIDNRYKIIREVSPGDLFDAFEALHTSIHTKLVRVKRYSLNKFSERSKGNIKQFKLNAEAVSKMGHHPNILQTMDFFPDFNRPDIYYEITEPTGDRLDDIVATRPKPLSLEEQLSYLEPLCEALEHSHINKIYHRNLNPETVFISNAGGVKLADFDFAKYVDRAEGTIVKEGEILVDNSFTAPEVLNAPTEANHLCDIFSLGALWMFLAKPYEKKFLLNIKQIGNLNLPKNAKMIMEKMLSEAPDGRYQDIANVAEELKNLWSE